MSDYYIYNGELYSAEELAHHGVKGMKWGVRKKSIVADRPKGQQPSWQRQRSDRENKWIDDHGINPNRPNGTSNKINVNKEINKIAKHVGEKKSTRDRAAKITAKGAKATGKIVKTLGSAYIADQVLYGGKGTQLAKAAVLTSGRAAVTAYVMSRGGYDIKWYNRQGKRVG